MANQPQHFVIYDTTTDVDLVDASEDRVSRWVVGIEDQGSWTGSVQPQGRVIGSEQGFTNIGYFNFAAMADATAAITADANILIDASGLEVRLVVTVSAGSVEIAGKPLIG